jgi:quercetin dioxygenase-like cupin family protein
VRFTPGAHTAWHRHAVGQVLHVTEGVGYVQSRGEELIELRPGDTVYTPPGEWHWHGATADGFMCHLALWEAPGAGADEPETVWGDKLRADEYPSA